LLPQLTYCGYLKEFLVPRHTPVLLRNNGSVFNLAQNLVIHSRTKQMELEIFFVREKVTKKQLVVQHIPGQDH